MLLWAQKAARDQAQGNYGDDVGGMRAQAIAAGLIKCVLPSLPVSAGARAWLRLACGELSHKAGPSRRPLSIARRFCGQKPVTTIKWGSVERFGTRSPTCRHVISVYYLLAAYLLRFATSASRVCGLVGSCAPAALCGSCHLEGAATFVMPLLLQPQYDGGSASLLAYLLCGLPHRV